MPGEVPIHNLRPNHAEWTPPCVIFLDSETRTLPDTEPEILALRLWVARIVDRRPTRAGKQADRLGYGKSADELAEWLGEVTRGRTTVWLYCHNLSFDLSTTRLPLALIEQGWSVGDAAIGGKAPWLRMSRGSRRLCMVDSWSWLPVALEAVGAALDMGKPELPDEHDSEQVWLERCTADVNILAAAICALMDWWDSERLGRWTLSGAGCGWNAYRHTPTDYPVTIDPNPAGIAADRAAVHGGRRGVWRVGTLNAGPYLELDFIAAYPTIAAHCPLPTRRYGAFTGLELDDDLIGDEDYSITARCVIRTDVPRWPVKLGDVNWYPVGRFVTDLAGPDIAEARRLGCLESIGPGYVHRMGYAMAPWAAWVLAVQRGQIPGTPPVARIAAKSWGRTVIGKWAARSFARIELGPSPVPGWSYQEGWDEESGTAGGMVDLGGRRWWAYQAGNADNAYPAVLAFVEAQVRSRLSRVVEALGPGCVVQADTDGLIVAQRTIGTRAARGHLIAPNGLTGAGRTNWCLDQINPVTAPLSLRVKRQSSHAVILGPQHLEVGGQRRMAGIPAAAELGADNVYRGRTWPKLQWQMAHGNPAGYARPIITARLKGPYATGWVTTRGTVVPVEAELAGDGTTRLVAWHRMSTRPAGARLTEGQHPELADLW